MKRKFMALFISLAMIFSSVISVPAKVFAESVNIPSFTDFVLNDNSSVKATWDKAAQTLTVKGNRRRAASHGRRQHPRLLRRRRSTDPGRGRHRADPRP